MSPTSLPSLQYSSSSSAAFSASFIPPPPIFTSAFNSSLIAPHFPPLSLPGGNELQNSKYEPKFETKYEPNLSARHGPLPSPPSMRTSQQANLLASSSDQLSAKVNFSFVNRIWLKLDYKTYYLLTNKTYSYGQYTLYVSNSRLHYVSHLHQSKCICKKNRIQSYLVLHPHLHYADWIHLNNSLINSSIK